MSITIEDLQTFDENLFDVIEALREDLALDLWELDKPEPTGNEIYNWVAIGVYKIQVQNLTEDRQRTIKRIERYVQSKHGVPVKGSIREEDIAKAKEFPIEGLYQGKLRKSGKSKSGKCPFHEERTASFHIYIKDNRFKCFGCDAHGDSIEFYMRQNGVDFINAVRKLICFLLLNNT